MPHGQNGMLLQVGDKVLVEATITRVQEGEDYCNITLETIEPCFPGNHRSWLNLNAKQVKKQVSSSNE